MKKNTTFESRRKSVLYWERFAQMHGTARASEVPTLRLDLV